MISISLNLSINLAHLGHFLIRRVCSRVACCMWFQAGYCDLKQGRRIFIKYSDHYNVAISLKTPSWVISCVVVSLGNSRPLLARRLELARSGVQRSSGLAGGPQFSPQAAGRCPVHHRHTGRSSYVTSSDTEGF